MTMDLDNALGGATTEYFSWASQDCTFKIDGMAESVTSFLIDPQSIRTGFGRLASGEAPDWVWAETPGMKIKQPSDEHKPAFGVYVYLTKESGSTATGSREWNSNGRAAREAIKGVWKEIDAQRKANEGKWASVDVSDIKKERFGQSPVINIPVLTLTGWVDSPESDSGSDEEF